MRHAVKRISDADLNPPTEQIQRLQRAQLKLGFRSHSV